MSKLTRFLGLSVIALALAAGPAATGAAAGVLDYGAIASCQYKVTQAGTFGWTEALLKRIDVSPPTITKPTGTKSVGWRFVVKRSLVRWNGPWKVTYRSPIQRAGSSAGLSPMTVGVAVPNVEDRSHVHYLVVIKMFRYDAAGSLVSKTSHLMGGLDLIMDGEEYVTDTYCPGLALQWFD